MLQKPAATALAVRSVNRRLEGNRLKGGLPGGTGRGNRSSRSVRIAPVMAKSGGKIFHHPFTVLSRGTQVRLSSWRARSVIIIIIEALPSKTRTHTRQLSPIRLQLGWMLHLGLKQQGEVRGFSRQKKKPGKTKGSSPRSSVARDFAELERACTGVRHWSRKSKLQQRTNWEGRGESMSGTHWCLCKWRQQCFVSLTDILTFKHRL